jgi:signal recognition particle subunit SRP68
MDAYQQVEIEAYTSLMQGIYLMECKNFQTALDNLLRAKIIYQKISNFKDTLEEVIYKEKVGQIDTLLRQCAFSLKTAGITTEGDKVIAGMVQAYPQRQSLEEQVAKTKSQAKRDMIESMEEIAYNNKIIPLKTEKLKQVFKRVQS